MESRWFWLGGDGCHGWPSVTVRLCVYLSLFPPSALQCIYLLFSALPLPHRLASLAGQYQLHSAVIYTPGWLGRDAWSLYKMVSL